MVSVGLCVHHSHLKWTGGTADFSPNLGIVKPHHFRTLEQCLASRSAAEDLFTSAQMEHEDESRMSVCITSLWWSRGRKEDDNTVVAAVASWTFFNDLHMHIPPNIKARGERYHATESKREANSRVQSCNNHNNGQTDSAAQPCSSCLSVLSVVSVLVHFHCSHWVKIWLINP